MSQLSLAATSDCVLSPCRPYQPCPVGVELQRRERKDGGR